MDTRLPRIELLLLEDDTLFGASLCEFLEEEGYSVFWVKSINEAMELTFQKEFSLYILDINLPDGDGKEFLKDLREANDKTVALFLTSYKDKESLKEGFLCGGDDYLTKPVDLDELLLRIQALLKRSGKITQSVTFSNGVIFDMKQYRLFQNGKDLKFTVKAMKLLKLFIQNSGEVLSKEEIQDQIWGEEEFSEGSLRVYINRLKKILPPDSIVNLKGVGYRFEIR